MFNNFSIIMFFIIDVASAGTFSKEMKCVHALRESFTSFAIGQGFYDSKSKSFVFEEGSSIFVVSDNNMKECPISEKFRNSASFAIPLNGERVFYTDKKKGSVAIRCIDKINDTTKGQFYNYLNKRISNLPRILAIQESLFYQQCSPSHPRAFERIIDSTGKDVTCGKTKKPREATPEYYLERLKNCEGATPLKATAEKAKATIDGKPSASTQETTNSQTLPVR